MKHASVTQKDDHLFIETYSQTTTGLWISVGEVCRIRADDHERAGEALLTALQRSSVGIPHPSQSEWKNFEAPLLRAAAARSWSAFMRNTKSVGIDLQDGIIRLIPDKNCGPKKGYEPIETAAIEIPAESSPAQVGTALREAMTRAL